MSVFNVLFLMTVVLVFMSCVHDADVRITLFLHPFVCVSFFSLNYSSNINEFMVFVGLVPA